MADAPTPIRPREETLRRIDWLAVAPWLLVLRAVGATIGWPVVFGAVGSILLGPLVADISDPSAHVEVAWEATLRHLGAPAEIFVRGQPWLIAIRVLAWLLVGLLIVRSAAWSLTNSQVSSRRWSFTRVARAYCRAIGAVAILATFAGLTTGGLFLWGRALEVPVLCYAAAALAPVAMLVGAFSLLVSLVSLSLGFPLLLATVAIDDADSFDGLSRMFAYLWQRIGTLVLCVLTAAVVGVVAAFAMELMLGAMVATISVAAPRDLPHDPGWVLAAAIELAIRAARGFYPAYFFSAATATYLVMRHAVDGQPIDEIAQPSADA